MKTHVLYTTFSCMRIVIISTLLTVSNGHAQSHIILQPASQETMRNGYEIKLISSDDAWINEMILWKKSYISSLNETKKTLNKYKRLKVQSDKILSNINTLLLDFDRSIYDKNELKTLDIKIELLDLKIELHNIIINS